MRRAAVAAVLVSGAMGCSLLKAGPEPPAPPVATPAPTVAAAPPVRTVPPGTPTPEGGAALPTRPIKDEKAAEAAKKAGKAIGPVVSFAGVARADGRLTQPDGSKNGIPVYHNYVGSGFMIVVEGKPGISNAEVGRSVFRYDPSDPTQRPDVELQVNRPLGDGNPEVCDARRPKIGGIPAVDPPSFAETPAISAAINDVSCRFETFIESNSSCTVDHTGDFSFAKPNESTTQFCLVVAKAWNFPKGDTLVSVRLRDVDGNPGPVSRFILSRTEVPTPVPRAAATPTPTVSRRRP